MFDMLVRAILHQIHFPDEPEPTPAEDPSNVSKSIFRSGPDQVANETAGK